MARQIEHVPRATQHNVTGIGQISVADPAEIQNLGVELNGGPDVTASEHRNNRHSWPILRDLRGYGFDSVNGRREPAIASASRPPSTGNPTPSVKNSLLKNKPRAR